MDDRTQTLFKTKAQGAVHDMIFPDFPDDENTATTTVTKSRRVSFGTNLVKEFIVGSAVSAQCVSEYEQAFSSSDSSNANSSYSAVESGILDQHTFVVEEKSKVLQPIPPPNGPNVPDPEILEKTQTKRPKFASTICFSADSPTADMEFTEGCITLAKSILDKKNKEMTVIIQAKPKEEEKVKEEETKYFDGSQFEMSMTKCFKSRENKKDEKRFDLDEKTRIFSSHEDDMSMTKCDKLFRMRQAEVESDESLEDDSKENQIPLDLIMRHLDKDNTDFEKSLFHPQKSLSDVLNANSLDLSNESEKLNLNESMDISNNFQSEFPKAKNDVIHTSEEKTADEEEKSRLNVTKTIEEKLYISREEIILRKEHLVLVQKEGESLTGIRTAYESSLEEEEEKEAQDAEMEITLTGTGNIISDAVNEKEKSNDMEMTKDMVEDVTKTIKSITEDEVIDKSIADEKMDQGINTLDSKEIEMETETETKEIEMETETKEIEMETEAETETKDTEMETETKEITLETPKEQMDLTVSKEEEEEETTKGEEDEKGVVVITEELSFGEQQETSMDLSKKPTYDEVILTEDKETKELSLEATEEQKDIVETSLVKPEEKCEEEKEEQEQQQNVSDMEMTLAKQKKSKEMSFDEVVKEITKEHVGFDEEALEKYFEKDPEGDLEGFLEKDMEEEVEMQSVLEELNDDSVNRSEVSLKDPSKSLCEDEIVIPIKEVSVERVEVAAAAAAAAAEPSKVVKAEREPPLADVKVIECLKDQSKENNCIWKFVEVSYEENENTGIMSFCLELFKSSATIKFTIKTSEDDGLDACSAISSAEIQLNPDEEPKTMDYKTAVNFGYEKLKKYFQEEQKMAKTTRHVPYFLDQMNLFSLKLNDHLTQIHMILSLYPGSRLKGSVLSFRLFSFPLLFSSTVSIDLTDLFRLSKSCLSFNTDFGSLDERKIKEIFENCSNSEGHCILCAFVTSSTKYIMKLESQTGDVSKRNHIRLLYGVS